MLVRLLVTLAAAGLLVGCSSVGTVTTNEGEPGLRELNRAMQGKVVRLELKEGQKINVMGLRVAADSTTWVNTRENAVETIATNSIRQLSIHKAGSGAIRGLIVGAIAGAAAGGVRAKMQGDDPPGDPLALTEGEKYRIYPAAHAVYASLVTTPLGAIIGTRKVYRFEDRSDLPAVVSER